MKQAAQIISYICHPAIIPTVMLVCILQTAGYLIPIGANSYWSLVQVIFLLTFIFPVITIWVLYRFHVISSIELRRREERILPFIFTFTYYAAFTYVAHERLGSLGSVFFGLLLSGTVSVGVTLLASFFFKISAHAFGIWGAIGTLAALLLRHEALELFYPLVLLVVLSGLVMSARLYLKAHTYTEILAGLSVGFLTSFCVTYLYS